MSSAIEGDGFAIIPSCLDDSSRKRLSDSLDDTQCGQRNLLRELIIQELARSQEVHRVLTPMLGPNCFAVKGILFNKTQKSNWKVPWHQDLTITVQERLEAEGFGPWTIKGGEVNVQPREEVLRGILAIRIHLDANDHQNGPLRVIPGSHKLGRLTAERSQSGTNPDPWNAWSREEALSLCAHSCCTHLPHACRQRAVASFT